MSEEKFFEWLKAHNIAICDKLVRLRYKYYWETEWTYSNEVLEVNHYSDTYYDWLDDWNEGQEQIEILGYVNIDDIPPECFEHLGKGVINMDRYEYIYFLSDELRFIQKCLKQYQAILIREAKQYNNMPKKGVFDD